MRMSMLAIAAGLLMVVINAVPAAAITYGEPDAGEHPYVGLVILYSGVDPSGNPIMVDGCSGTLLSPTVMLTAAHCTFGADLAQVYMEEAASSNPGFPMTGGILATPYTHPGFDDFSTRPDTSDVGVVVLDRPYSTSNYGALPELGALDSLASQRGQQDIRFELVGYGLQGIRPDFIKAGDRFKTVSKLNNLVSRLNDGYNLQTSSNPGVGGGACTGDSGGPVLFNNTNVIAGIASFNLNDNCKGNNFSYRADITSTQDFVYGFL